ncbi:OLC1v1037996C3 [Oldenlandia corymbosa var. corymbosa]|nr:OLC1v1037996C3 [Oldenlandia corymbosa var. corymbosa]
MHTVAKVTKTNFDSCNPAGPISLTTNGPASINLSTAGEHYFLCTIPGHCDAGQKLAVNVSAAPSTSPAPAPPPATPSPPPVAEPTPVPTPEPTSSPSPSPAPKTSPAPAPSKTGPKTYIVGDSVGWTIPPSGFSYQTWARNKTFNAGDILVFNFPTGAHDVVALTSKAAYDSCNGTGVTPITAAPARITLTAGEKYYICTVPGHCLAGQKLSINVTGTASTSPAPGPSPTSGGTTPSPSSGTPAPSSPGAASAPPPPNSAPTIAGAALPLTFLAVAFAFFY